MPISSYDQVFQRRSKVVKVEQAMEVKPLTTVQQNPLLVYTRRPRLKPSDEKSIIGQTVVEIGPLSGDQKTMAESIGRQTVAGAAEVGTWLRKRRRSVPSIRSNQDSMTTDDEAIVVSDENACKWSRRSYKSCRRSLRFNEDCYVKEKEFGCLKNVKKMEPILSSTCRRKRSQVTRLRKILLLAHWMLPNVPRNCKKKRSRRQKMFAGCTKKAATKPLGGNEVPSSSSPPKNNPVMSSVEKDPSSVAPRKTSKQKRPPRPCIRKARKKPDRVTSIGENEASSSIAPKTKKSKKKTDELEDFRCMDIVLASQIVADKFLSLTIDDDDDDDDGDESGILACQPVTGNVVPYKAKQKQKPPKVLLDPQTLKVWNRTMFLEDGEAVDPDEEEQWKHERELFVGRVKLFISRMHLTLGPRRFMPWKGSVVDSVVGVFLTQNVSDFLSSNAYLSLCAKFPKGANENGGIMEDKPEDRVETSDEVRKETEKNEPVEDTENMRSEEIVDKKLVEETRFKAEYLKVEEVEDIKEDLGPGNEETKIPPASVKDKKNKKKADKKVPRDWTNLRETIINLFSHEPRIEAHMDTVDWERVRCVSQDVLADTIKDRGQQNDLARKIQEFLNRLVSVQGSIDLEWLRYCPPLKVKDYLLEVNGLGLKSVECVRLLALQHVAFPVDVNVGRIAIRLGWVPLEPMTENLQLHLLENYPPMDEIQKYLWPRLCTIDSEKLYELHYHLITFGKVFCTKKKPNCGACPLKGDCKHFASTQSSAKNTLPAPTHKSMESSTNSFVVNKRMSNYSSGTIEFVECEDGKHACEPIIEYPESPKSENHLIINSNSKSIISEPTSPLSGDIEDLCKNRVITSLISGDIEDLCKDDGFLPIDVISRQSEIKNEENKKAMFGLSPRVASYPMRKLKVESRLRTEHHVYEIPDGHPLIAKLEPRELDDPCPYLLAVWPDETASMQEGSCHFTEQEKIETIRGTILIPCRTATRSRFPLNGTYFQVNEVFADDESSNHPIDVPRNMIWNLTRRIAYAGTSVLSIFRGLSFIETYECFWRGFICVRGFDRKTRSPRPLCARFHLSLKYVKEQKGNSLKRNNLDIYKNT